MSFSIVRPEIDDIPAITHFLEICLSETAVQNGIQDSLRFDDEIASKLQKLKCDIVDEDKNCYHLLAKQEDRILGVGAFFPISKIILDNIIGSHEDDFEIGSLYVDRNFQRIKIGTSLFNALRAELYNRGVDFFFLSAGFKSSQDYWNKKVGNSVFAIQNFWGPGKHELIWKCKSKWENRGLTC